MNEKQLKLEEKQEYINSLNSLNSKEFVSFLKTTSLVRQSKNDLIEFVSSGSKPVEAIMSLLKFFSNPGDLVLNLFAGTGRDLIIASELNREVYGVDNSEEAFEKYMNLVNEDVLLEPSPYLVEDAIQAFSSGKLEFIQKSQFDFILIDPPSKKFVCNKNSKSIEYLSPSSYCTYLAELLSSANMRLKQDKYMVLLVSDMYNAGKYIFTPGKILEYTSAKLVGIKIFYRELDESSILNKKVYAPAINHFYCLIFRK